MHHKLSLIRAALLISVGLVVGCGDRNSNSLANTNTSDNVLVLTDVDFNPDRLLPETQPVADYLSDRLKRSGFAHSEVRIAPDVETVTQWMESGEADVYFDSVYPAMLVMEETGAQPLLRRWKDGVPEYSTYFVSRQADALTQIEDLQGEMIALQEPSSSSGFMFPMVFLLGAGISPVEKLEANHAVERDQVGYVFSGREEVTVEWILEDKVAAGAIDSETWTELPEEVRSQLKIIAETDAFPRHVAIVSPTLNQNQKAALKKALIGMNRSRGGREALEAFGNTAKFDDFPDGADAEINRLAEAYAQLQAYLSQSE